MKKKIILFLFILIILFTNIYGQKKKKFDVFVSYSYIAQIHIYKVSTIYPQKGIPVKITKLIASKDVFIKKYRYHQKDSNLFDYDSIKLKNDILIVLKADFFDLLIVKVYKKGKILFSLNQKSDEGFAVVFQDGKDYYWMDINSGVSSGIGMSGVSNLGVK